MDALILSLWAHENHDEIVGARITETGLFGPWRASLRLGEERWLTLGIERACPSVFVDARPRRKPTGGMPGEMDAVILGAAITGLTPLPGERILRIETDLGTLVVELVPSAPALVALDPEGRVVSLHANARSRPRRLVTGNPYEPPAAPDGPSFPGLERASREALGDPLPSSWLDVLAHAVGLTPGVVTRPDGVRARVRAPGTGNANVLDAPSWNDAVRRGFVETLRVRREADAARAFTSRLKSLERRVERALRATEKDLEKAREWPTWERYGSALMANAHLVKRGATEARVPDVFDPEAGEIVIPIDPRINANANAAVYMKRARRGQRSIDVIEKRRDGLRSDHEWITERRERAAATWTPDEIAHLETLLVKHRVRRQSATASPGGRDDRRPGDRFHPRRFRSADGWLILVGRNNDENDHLSLKIAKQDDIWLHAHAVAGSHVVLKREGKKDNPSKQTLEEAAAIAALYSKARHAGTVPVVYTLAKYVRKPRKAPPGLVTCTREKTILVRPADESKLVTEDDERGDD
jgi:predicted ribosome quality control (RQC) complex YloA/Tae2 family protein